MIIEINISKQEIMDLFRDRIKEQGFEVTDMYENIECTHEDITFVGLTFKVNVAAPDKNKILA